MSERDPIQPTGIPNLDQMLGGGLPRGHVVLLSGDSGTGKTTLSMQWLFNGYTEHGENGLYITLTETITKAIENLKKMDFYDPAVESAEGFHVTDMRSAISLLDLDENDLDKDDIEQILDTIGQLVAETDADRVVLDSITALAYMLRDKSLIRYFVFRLGTLLDSMDCTTVMTSEVSDTGYSAYGVEEFISDGILLLRQEEIGSDLQRDLQIIKMRGLSYESNRVTFDITDGGIVLHRVQSEMTYESPETRISTGITGVDEMCGGGVFENSVSMVSGPPGSGKTLMGLHFIMDGLRNGETCLHIGYEESKKQLQRNARYFGMPLHDYIESGQLLLSAEYPEERFPTEQVVRIKRLVEENDVDRIVIDPVSAVDEVFPEETYAWFTRHLVGYVKNHGVTAMFTVSVPTLMETQDVSTSSLSTLTDNIFMLKYAETQGRLSRVLSVLKTRGTDHDNRLRQYYITSNGMEVGEPVSAFEGILSGSPRKVGSTIKEQLHNLFVDELGPMGAQEFNDIVSGGVNEAKVESYVDDLVSQGIMPEDHASDFLDKVRRIMDDNYDPVRHAAAEDSSEQEDGGHVNRFKAWFMRER